jgi:hypothetical protein
MGTARNIAQSTTPSATALIFFAKLRMTASSSEGELSGIVIATSTVLPCRAAA